MISSKYGGYFPYPEFRPFQEQMLDKVQETVLKGNHTVLMIDAPTGSGKTSVIAPILANKGDKKFVVAVRTNSQIEIYLEEINKICNETSKKPTIAYIVGKEKICKLSSNSAMCNVLVENTKKFIEYKINKLQRENYDASSDESVIEVLEHEFDEKNPISFEHFINEQTIFFDEKIKIFEQKNKEMMICPYYLFSKIGYFDINLNKVKFLNSTKIETKAQKILYRPILPDQAKKINNDLLCFYELMAIAAKKSDIVVLMHSHIVNESIRNATYTKIGIKQEEAILLIDEAHNIGEETEQKNSEKLDVNLINEAIKQIEKLNLFSWDEIPGKDESRLIEYLIENFGVNWITTAKIERISHIGTISISTENNSLSLRLNNEKTRVNLTIDDGRTDELPVKKEHGKLNVYNSSENNSSEVCNKELAYNILLKLKNILENLQKLGVNEGRFDSDLLINSVFGNIDQIAINDVISKRLSFSNQKSYDNVDFDSENELNKVFQFLSVVNYHNNNANTPYILLKGLDADEPAKKKFFLEIKNIDPSPQLSKIADSHYATIMMSGTFSPIDFYELYYFGKNGRAEKCSLPNSFPGQNRLIIGVNNVDTISSNRDDQSAIQNYKKCINSFTTDIPGNLAIFCTSDMKKRYSKYCLEIARKNNKEFFEQRDDIPVEEIFERFKNAKKKNNGGVLLALIGGKLSEGKDYNGDSLKAAMVMGLPLGPPDYLQKSKNEHYKKRYGEEKGDFIAYRLPAMNKALQALGRVIRARDETGILVLADSRFTKHEKNSVWQYLPSWAKDEMIICNSLQIRDKIKNWIENIKQKETQKEMDDRIVSNRSFLTNTDLKGKERKTDVPPTGGSSGSLISHKVDKRYLFCPKCKSMMLRNKCRKCGYEY